MGADHRCRQGVKGRLHVGGFTRVPVLPRCTGAFRRLSACASRTDFYPDRSAAEPGQTASGKAEVVTGLTGQSLVLQNNAVGLLAQ